ncbi:MAG TPA: sigma-70 family RNA polymerase sigma factor [Candidatus Polarisedimenticolaceae bacterium]|nr:sigma-70 family RNA polymerase sigma factor [Candidatus Polarisedimenticolaceae bacterium]
MSERSSIGGRREPAADSGVGTDETALLAAIRAGDADAFDRVAREYAPRLYRMALRLTGRREEAEDLVQETLLRTLPALRGFAGRARLSTYLFRALGNLWKNRVRSRKRSRLVAWLRVGDDAEADGDPVSVPVDPSPSAEERLSALDRAEQIRRAVLRLDADRRLTLLLREVEELSYEEIARMTGVPVGTVRSRLARARSELRRLLGETT